MINIFNTKPGFDDLIKSAVKSILKNKSRTVLTSLGIIIGVTSVILLTSIGNGLKKYVSDQFESLGSNLVYVLPGKMFNDNGGFSSSESSMVTVSFNQKIVNDLKRQIKNVIVFPAVQSTVEVKSPNAIKKDISFVGVTFDYGKHLNMTPKEGFGRWFTKEEDDKNSEVAVVGWQIAQDLFPNQTALNRKMIINSKSFKIIGIIEKKGSSMGGPSLDSHMFVPINTHMAMTGSESYNAIYIKAQNKEDIESIKTQAKKILTKYFKDTDPNNKDAFSVFDQNQLLTSINTIIGTLTIALSGIAAISLVVGGIGIMNIMLVTVTERTKEIGLRKAIGAYPRAILLQFLFEAIILSGLGGVIGIIFGGIGTFFINKFFPAQITTTSILLAFGVSFLVGVVFGVAPARKASKLSPIEALRYE